MHTPGKNLLRRSWGIRGRGEKGFSLLTDCTHNEHYYYMKPAFQMFYTMPWFYILRNVILQSFFQYAAVCVISRPCANVYVLNTGTGCIKHTHPTRSLRNHCGNLKGGRIIPYANFAQNLPIKHPQDEVMAVRWGWVGAAVATVNIYTCVLYCTSKICPRHKKWKSAWKLHRALFTTYIQRDINKFLWKKNVCIWFVLNQHRSTPRPTKTSGHMNKKTKSVLNKPERSIPL